LGVTFAGEFPFLRIWLYIFGCVALEFITTDAELLADPATTSIVKENFGSLPKGDSDIASGWVTAVEELDHSGLMSSTTFHFDPCNTPF